MQAHRRLGIIGSSGGSALAAATSCIRATHTEPQWIVVTDRPCGLESWSMQHGYPTHRIDYASAEIFSKNAYEIFNRFDCDDILLFFTRRVASPLIDHLRVWNIHPSLLPAFPGLHAESDAISLKVKLYGATLHRADEGLDTGPIIAQAASHLPVGTKLEKAQHLSYIQKVWLTLVWFELAHSATPGDAAHILGPGVELAYPGISDATLRESFTQWLSNDRG